MIQQHDIILNINLNDVKKITNSDYKNALCFKQKNILMYSNTCSAGIVDINKDKLNIFIQNILLNNVCYFDYIIEDFGEPGVATFIYKNDFIYYTMYDDVFSNPFDFVKIKVDNIILNRLTNMSQDDIPILK